MFSTLIIHSHQLDEHGEPWKEYVMRLLEWLKLYTTGNIATILVTWGIATPNIPLMHSEVAKKYLIQQGIDPTVILTEKTGSLETVGEFVFARTEHDDRIRPDKSRPIIHISSDYHIPRMRSISALVWWNRSNIAFHGIPWFWRDPTAENKSFEAFYTTFQNVKIGDMTSIERRLWKDHGLYKNHPNNPNNTTS